MADWVDDWAELPAAGRLQSTSSPVTRKAPSVAPVATSVSATPTWLHLSALVILALLVVAFASFVAANSAHADTTASPTPTDTALATASPTGTATATASPTATVTITATPDPAPTPSQTAQPTASPSPAALIDPSQFGVLVVIGALVIGLLIVIALSGIA